MVCAAGEAHTQEIKRRKNNAMMTTPLNTFHLTIYLLSLTSNFLYILAFPSPHISHAGRIVSTCSADCSCVMLLVLFCYFTSLYLEFHQRRCPIYPIFPDRCYFTAIIYSSFFSLEILEWENLVFSCDLRMIRSRRVIYLPLVLIS